ncbi:MAG: hypothetical protein L3J88_05790 [Gammaproteobacteria bacterium]|nr:hypothetical protein [Gammaproteobacteria bacterium]MCF6362848.1 hypothetical protein [Gammaproteobacteria bacterium]
MAGIDIKQIKTVAEYRRAREAVSPYFTSWLTQRIAKWPESLEFNLLKVATLGTPAEIEKILNQLDGEEGGNHGDV